jgi:C1A family cysteine protease
MTFAVLLTVLGAATVTWGQLSAADIAALQKQAAAEGWTFTVTENDATRQPLENLCGFVVPENWQELAPVATIVPQRDLPAAWDWRSVVGTVPIRNQGGCGSCWAFGTLGPLEFNILIKDGIVVDLSEQWLVSCNSDGWSCAGGWWAHSYHQWKTDPCAGTGAVPEADFPYVAYNAACNCPYEHTYLIDSWANIQAPQGGSITDAIKQAIFDYGPVSVALYAGGAFQSYGGGVFNACEYGQINHAVTLVGWDDNLGAVGAWLLRNSWGTYWGEGGYMWIEYGCNQVGYNPCFVNYAGSTKMLFEYPDGKPLVVPPNQTLALPVNILPNPNEPIAGTEQLHYSINGAAYQVVPLTPLGNHQYLATFPPRGCLDQFRWYVSAEQAPGDVRTDPRGAPQTANITTVAEGEFFLLDDNFEADHGWTVQANATSGNWERGIPELSQYWNGSLGQWITTQPGTGHSGSGAKCYVTGAAAGADSWANDVDAGPTVLLSPTLNLYNRDGTISFWYWYYGNSTADRLDIALTNNGGSSWAYLPYVNTPHDWTYIEFKVSDFMAPTANVKVRFRALDFAPDSLVEALVDDFKVYTIGCDPTQLIGDMNCDGWVDFDDINPFVVAITDQVLYETVYPGCHWLNGDCNQDGTVDFEDINGFVVLIAG